MGFSVQEIARHAPVVRVVVVEVKGSVPRGVGTAMLVSAEGLFGTIGGGALEFEAVRRARDVLALGGDRLDRVPLGPSVGQCCGGAVTLLSEVWDAARLDGVTDIVARPLPGGSSEMPLAVTRLLATARNAGDLPTAGIYDGWMVEPVSEPEREIWVWGAGHVGRAVVGVLAPLPGLRILWADFDDARFSDVPDGVETLVAANPADLVSLAPDHADHLILTYSHALDLELCHRLLGRPFGSVGLIGSATKWARFRSRLSALGHGADQIARITCPIGDPSLGKHPQEIALGVAMDLLKVRHEGDVGMERQG
jgi:xanthine dehydrogenase accessory factor